MNAKDQKEFDAMLKNPDFDKLYVEFVANVKFPFQRLNLPMAAYPLRAGEIAQGKSPKIIAFTNKGEDVPGKLGMASALMRLAEHYALHLSAFFPEARRWHWQEIFFNQAVHGTGTVSQRQGGGRNRDDEWIKLFLQWKQSGYDPKIKRQLWETTKYDWDTFNRTMKRYKNRDKQGGTKTQ